MALNLQVKKLIFTVLVVIVILTFCSDAGAEPTVNTANALGRNGKHDNPLTTNSPRTKRSPFIVAFQVTRPPGLFQFSMRKPVIMGVMSNMTSMLLGSELARMVSRGLSSSGLQQFLVPLNATTTVKKTK